MPLDQHIGSCTCRLRINPPGSPVDRHRSKKAYTRGLSWPPSVPLLPGDALEAGRADARRLFRAASLAVSHHHGLLTDSLAAATVARGTVTPHAATTPDRSVPRPSLAFEAASVWLSPSRWSAAAAAGPGVSCYEASKNCHTRGTQPTAAASPPLPCRAWRRDAQSLPHAGAG